MNLIPNVLTPMTADDVMLAFSAAFNTMAGKYPSEDCLAILTAQSCLECGRWKSMHCFNFGNIRPATDWKGNYCQFRCNEQISPGKWVWYDPPSSGSNFVAFRTAEEGAAFYIAKLAKRWPEAWTAALNGDAAMFVHGLKLKGYFTANEALYLAGVSRLVAEFKGQQEAEELQWDLIRGIVNGAIQPDYSEVK